MPLCPNLNDCYQKDSATSHVLLVTHHQLHILGISLTSLKCEYNSGINTHTMWLNSYILRYLLKNQKKCVHKDLLLNVPSSALSSGPKLEAVQRPTREWINKIQYGNKKEPGADNTLHRNELHKHARSKTPDAKDNVVCTSVHAPIRGVVVFRYLLTAIELCTLRMDGMLV